MNDIQHKKKRRKNVCTQRTIEEWVDILVLAVMYEDDHNESDGGGGGGGGEPCMQQ